MERLYWIGDKPKPLPSFGGYKYEADVCPGFCVELESVAEGGRAYAWFQKGQLELAFPNPPAKVIEACEVAMQAWNSYEAEQRALAASGAT
jgi:hypothetical protein